MACPDDLGDPLYKIFFNPECIAQLNKPHQRCPSTEVAFFMDFISSGLRFESISLTALGVFVLVGLLQLGGIPDPRDKGRVLSSFGTSLWLLWMSCVALQFITTSISLLMIILATFAAIQQYRVCLVNINGGLGSDIGAFIGLMCGLIIFAILHLFAYLWKGYIPLIFRFFLCPIFYLYFGDIDNINFYRVHDEGHRLLPLSRNLPINRTTCIYVLGTCSALGAAWGAATDGAPVFNVILPSLLFHPAFFSKSIAMVLLVFNFSQGLKATGLDVDSRHVVTLYCRICIYPFAFIGLFYWLLSSSFAFSISIFVPTALSLNCVCICIYFFIRAPYFTGLSNNKAEPISTSQLTQHGVELFRHSNPLTNTETMDDGRVAINVNKETISELEAEIRNVINQSKSERGTYDSDVIEALDHILAEYKPSYQESSINNRKTSFPISNPKNCFAQIKGVKTVISAWEGAFWWSPENLWDSIKNQMNHDFSNTTTKPNNIILSITLRTSALAALAPMCIFGTWVGIHALNGSRTYTSWHLISDLYSLFFKCFVDFRVSVPSLFDFNFDLSQIFFVLFQLPSFGNLPPRVMLEGAREFAALSTIVAFVKPFLCAISTLCAFMDLVQENKNIGEMVKDDTENEMETKSFSASATDKKVIKYANFKGKYCRVLTCSHNHNVSLKALESVSKLCSKIEEVDFSECPNLSGELNGDLIVWLCQMRNNGKEVHLRGCGSLSLKPNMTSLLTTTFLNLGGITTLKGDLPPLAVHLISKGHSNFDSCEGPFKLPADLRSFSNVQTFNLSSLGSRLQFDIAVFRGCTFDVKVLDFQMTGVFGDISVLHTFESLEYVDLDGCKDIYGSIPPRIIDLISHGKCILRGCEGPFEFPTDLGIISKSRKIDVSSIGHALQGNICGLYVCTDLEEAYFNECSHLNGDVNVLKHCTSLKYVSFEDTQVQGVLPPRIIRLISEGCCSFLRCQGPFSLPQNIAEIEDVSHLDLSSLRHSLVGDIGTFESCEHLTDASFEGSLVTGSIPPLLISLISEGKCCFQSCPGPFWAPSSLASIAAAAVVIDLSSLNSTFSSDLEVFGVCNKLQILNLIDCHVCGCIDILQNMKDLKEVHFGLNDERHDKKQGTKGAKITGNILVLNCCKCLEVIEFKNCLEIFGSIEVLGNLIYLKRVIFWLTKVDGDISVLRSLKQVTEITFRLGGISGDIKFVQSCKELTKITFNETRKVHGDIGVIQHCPKLSKAFFASTPVSGHIDIVTKCSKLESLIFGLNDKIVAPKNCVKDEDGCFDYPDKESCSRLIMWLEAHRAGLNSPPSMATLFSF